MEPIIKSITLKRFRSIPAETVMLDNPTFLVGANGSGKSSFVEVFAFLADALSLSLPTAFSLRAGISSVRNRTSGKSYPPNLGIRIDLGSFDKKMQKGHYAFEVRALPNYGFEVVREQCFLQRVDGTTSWFDRSTKHGFQSNHPQLMPALDISSLALPVIGGDIRFSPLLKFLSAMRVYSIEPAKLRELQDPDSGIILRTDGSNTASVLQEIERRSKNIQYINESLEQIVPHTKSVKAIKHGNKLSLEFVQEWAKNKRLKFESFNMSDGTLRALGLLVAVYQQPAPSLLVIEEPEATIHPGALGAVLELIRTASERIQVIVTTHSPELLDAKWIEGRHLRIVSWQDGATHINEVSEPARQALKQHLMGAGELLRANALEPDKLFNGAGPQNNIIQASLFEELP